MATNTRIFRIGCSLLLAGFAGMSTARAQVTFYSALSSPTSHTDWLAAAGSTPAVLDFEGYGDGTDSHSGALAAQAAAAGVVFQPFASNGFYPQVRAADGGHGAVGQNWLGNNLSQALDPNSAISWTFNQPVRAFGFYDVGSDDGFEVIVYSTGAVSLGSFFTTEQNGSPRFWGFVVDQDVGRVDVIPNTGNGYIGIDGLSVVAIPEPSVFAGLLGVGALLFAWHRRSTATS